MRHAWIIPAAVLAGCAATPRTTRITTADLEETAAAVAEKLRGSSFLADRAPDSPPMVIAVDKVQNLSSDIIPSSEQWWLVERVAAAQPILVLARDRNIRFTIPREHLSEGRRRGNLPEDFAQGRNPTHQLTATIRSATRAAGLARTDAYLLDFQITDLSTGRLVWNEGFSFKRQAFGKSYD